ncbi:multi-copper oxidase [Mycena alexandri]|uniref:Multi-copper oxidase n=1 Tax=Mycena alexandri TaxID=1745969 RepID=A0AAD6S444_9AGAR|nr:multi-copper oxidase [Mycena alexandri]
MADAVWRDASDEEPLLPENTLDSVAQASVAKKQRAIPTLRRRSKRLLACVTLGLLAFSSLFWISPWPQNSTPANGGPPSVMPDAFVLDPAFDRTAEPQTRIYRWTVSSVSVPGTNGQRIVVNGRYPGPIIEANVDDRIMVYLTNGLSDGNGTSIHWHGLPQPNTPFYDGPAGTSQCPIPPGATLLYNFTLGGWTGTTFWHGHTDMQHTDGLYGAIVVHGPDDLVSPHYDSDHALVVSDIYLEPVDELLGPYLTETSPDGSPEPVPDWAEINGRGAGAHNEGKYFEVDVQPGTTTRLRLINAGSIAPFRVSIDGHVLTIIEADGAPVEPTRVRDLVMQVAQRYSVLVTRAEHDSTEAFWIRAVMVDKGFGYKKCDSPAISPPLIFHHVSPNITLETRAILRYTSSDENTSTTRLPLPTTTPGPPPGDADWYKLPVFDEWALRPPAAVKYPPPAGPALTLPVAFSVRQTQDRYWRSYINDTSWNVLPLPEAALLEDIAHVNEGRLGVAVWPGDQLIAAVAHGQTVDFVITNEDTNDHPFHLHAYSPWLLGVGDGLYDPATAKLNTVNPLWRDTFTVPGSSWIAVRILADNAGYWTFHCHIAWHLITGGLFQIAIPPADGVPPVIPEDIKEQCRMWL